VGTHGLHPFGPNRSGPGGVTAAGQARSNSSRNLRRPWGSVNPVRQPHRVEGGMGETCRPCARGAFTWRPPPTTMTSSNPPPPPPGHASAAGEINPRRKTTSSAARLPTTLLAIFPRIPSPVTFLALPVSPSDNPFHRAAYLTGQTASGKTAVGVALARRLDAE